MVDKVPARDNVKKLTATNRVAVLAVYTGARTADMERFDRFHARTELIFADRYPDCEIPPRVRYKIAGLLGTFVCVLKRDYEILEINEPLFLRAYPRILVALAAANIRGLFAKKPEIVSYAIENADVYRLLHRRSVIAGPFYCAVARAVGRYILSNTERMAFGTQDALDNYMRAFGNAMSGSKVRVFEFLQPPYTGPRPSGDRSGVVFVGALEGRKGLRRLMRIWPTVSLNTGTCLSIVGSGEMEQDVARWSADRTDVSIMGQRSKQEIDALLSRAKVVVMLSQSEGFWKEQVGLPILEGLAHGCEIVTTSDTGLAAWLSQRGHAVLHADQPDADFVAALTYAVTREDRHETIRSTLPLKDGRLEAARWMWFG
ncbi:glycosyltransferase [Brevundimonas subvibrioides]|uniref:Glycosyl transferase group 1 n=1 Tax=Brevundimonas subvibrioides (strain ATCC 15264 / DSM 4735 / LMG 14903 / NBRC 16000 / CB 81) TaxID=633149 RepID=D9QP35_BRESC|nr:glycosyltransferase [Brevundimonas subvibrioides]ADL00468.1 glycosyl transferase group 1 [Brevundimonas subvibrioides ATCC 15264]